MKKVIHYNHKSIHGKKSTPFLLLKGTYYEMGYQYGSILKGQANEIYRDFDRLEEAYLSFIKPIVRPFARLYIKYKIKSLEKKIPPPYRDEIKGFSDAAGISYHRVIKTIFFIDVMKSISCTSIITLHKNNTIHGRNLDFYPPALGRYPVVIEYRPPSGNSYTLVNIVGYLPGLTGMNTEGISISINRCSLIKHNKKSNMPIGYMVREILNKSKKIKDIDALLKNYSTYHGWVVMAGSSYEKTAVLYDIAGRDNNRTTLKNRPYLYAVNSFKNDKLNREHRPISKTASEYNLNRQYAIFKKIDAIYDEQSMIDLLQTADFHHYRDVVGRFTINNYQTVQTIVMLPGKQEIIFSSSPAYAGWASYLKYSTATKKISLYRDRDERLNTNEIKGLISWMDRIYSNPISTVKNFANEKNLTLYHLESIFIVWNMKKDIVKIKKLVPYLKQIIKKYPDYVLPYELLAEVLVHINENQKAVRILKHAVNLKIKYDFDLMNCYKLMSIAYSKMHEHSLSSYYAKKTIDLINLYAIGKNEKKIIKTLHKHSHIEFSKL